MPHFYTKLLKTCKTKYYSIFAEANASPVDHAIVYQEEFDLSNMNFSLLDEVITPRLKNKFYALIGKTDDQTPLKDQLFLTFTIKNKIVKATLLKKMTEKNDTPIFQKIFSKICSTSDWLYYSASLDKLGLKALYAQDLCRTTYQSDQVTFYLNHHLDYSTDVEIYANKKDELDKVFLVV